MEPFVYEALPQRIVFGADTRAGLADEAARLGMERVLVLSGPRQKAEAEALAELLGPRAAGIFAGAAMHTPVEVTEKALAVASGAEADGLVAMGGGSAIGLGKALALRTDLDQIVVPTTYAGSEATGILGETEAGRKTTQRSPKLLPEVVLYDVELTLGLPADFSIASGMNAIAHAVEARYAAGRNPLTSLLALDAVRALATALPRIAADPEDRVARSEALYGAWAAGTGLGMVAMGLHHKLCHVLGGRFGLPHAQTHSALLPHSTAYNEVAARPLLAPIGDLLGASSAAVGLYELEARLGAPMRLADLGMPFEGIAEAADEAAASPYPNPRPIERARIRRLLEDAWHGRPPRLE